MKKVSNNSYLKLIANLFIFIAFTSACSNKDNVQDIQYTCPMHPDVVKNEPASCPICGMDLVRLHQNKAISNDSLNLADTGSKEGLSANTKTVYPQSGTFRDTVKLEGTITANTNNTKTVSSYINGRIEKLYVSFNFQKIAKGQRIMDIYSPDLVAAQQELLYLKQAEDLALMNQAKNKLRLLGMTDKDIINVIRSGKPNYNVGIYSPFNGFVLSNNTSNSEEDLNSSSTPLNLREGMYINAGNVLFNVYDNTAVWAEFSVDPNLSKGLKQHQKIKITTAEGKHINTAISSIQPFFKDGQNFSNIRIKLANTSGDYKIGELLTAKVVSDEISGLWIPKTSVYQSGGRTIVFIKKRNRLHPVTIRAVTSGNKIMVLNGLGKTDEIAENAAHLIDPEAFIKIDDEKK